MADIAGPTILSATRENGAFIRVQYSAGASGYTRMYYDVRTPTGAWRQATSETERKGWYVITSIAGAALDPNQSYQVKMRAAHSSGDPVRESSAVSVPAWTTDTPNLLPWERTGPTTTKIGWAGITGPDAVVQFQFRTTPSGGWTNWFSIAPSVSNGVTNTSTGIYAGQSYELRMHVTQYGVKSAFSNTRSINAFTVQAPSLVSVERTTPTSVWVVYESPTTADTTLTIQTRQQPTGSWVNAVTFNPISSGARTVSGLSPSSGYDIRLYTTLRGVDSGFTSSRSVQPWSTTAPQITSADRTSATNVTLGLSGGDSSNSYVIERRVSPTGSWSAVSSPSGTTTQVNVSAPDGALKYGYRAKTVTAGVSSQWSSERTVNAWFGLPQGVSDLRAERRTSGTVIDLVWATHATPENPYNGQRLDRADGTLGQFRTIAYLSSSASSYVDTGRRGEESYRYKVVPYNSVGDASSAQIATSAASTNAPSSPNSVTATYVSDTAADVAWPDSSAPGKEVTSYEIRRWLLGAWSTVKTVPGTQLSWRDPGLAANGRYRYQVRASNAAGPAAAYSPDSADVVTTPSGATTVTATRQGANVNVAWAATAATIATSWTVSHTVSATPLTAPEEEWFPLSAGTLAGTSRSWPHTAAAGGVPHTYRIRPTVADGPEAPWVLSNTVSPFAAPNVPTLGTVAPRDATATIRLPWTHNPIDGTGQSSATVEFRKAGTAWTTVTVTGSDGFYDIPAGTLSNGWSVEWKVSTKGADPTASPAASGAFQTGLRPVVSITAPTGGVVGFSVLDVAWTAMSQASWSARLLNADGGVVDARSGGSAERSTVFEGLLDRGVYTVEVTVNDGVQDSLAATVTVTVALDRPSPPSLTAVPDTHNASVNLNAASTGQGLKLNRINYLAGGLDDWTSDGQTQRVILSGNAGDVQGWSVTGSQFIEGVGSSGAATYPAGWVYRFSAMAAHSLPGMTADVGGNSGSASFPLPVLPQSLTALTLDSTGGGQDFTIGVPGGIGGTFNDQGTLYITTPSFIGAATEADLDAGGFFDGDTRRDGFVYGWGADGSAYEATPTMDPAEVDLTVATTVRIEILRDVGDGFKRVGDVTTEGQLDDLLPPTCTPFRYKARAWTAEGSYADSAEVAVKVESRDTHLNFGPGWTGHVTGGARTLTGTGGGRDGETVRYAGHHVGTRFQSEVRQPRRISVDMNLLRGTGVSSWRDWVDALSTVGNVTYRDPSGIIIEGLGLLAQWVPEDMYKQSIAFAVEEGEAAPEVAPKPLELPTSTIDFAAMFLRGIA